MISKYSGDTVSKPFFFLSAFTKSNQASSVKIVERNERCDGVTTYLVHPYHIRLSSKDHFPMGLQELCHSYPLLMADLIYLYA